METGCFPGKEAGKPESFQVSSPKGETRKPYTIIYSSVLSDLLLLVDADEEAETLRRRGIEDVIYTASEVHALKGKTAEEIRAVHRIKKVFLSAKIEAGGK